MKDFISKVTFGFLMAQLLPGAVVVFALTCTVSDISQPHFLLKEHITAIGEYWFGSTYLTVVFLFMTVGIGMVIHGVNWTVLAWLEYKYDTSRESFWHRGLVLYQIFLSPIKMVGELVWLLFAPNIEALTMGENVAKTKSDKATLFSFLQEFYLHFGQFYAHTAYALLATFICTVICCLRNFSWTKCGVAFICYFLTSLFFLLGRIQLGSLFKAERSLVEESSKDKSTPTPAGQ